VTTKIPSTIDAAALCKMAERGQITGGVLDGPLPSLARPGGQVTGIQNTVDTLPGKQLELMLQVMPGVKRIGLLVNINVPTRKVFWRNAETAAAALGVQLVPVDVRVPDDLDGAFRKLADERVENVLVPPDGMFLSERPRIAALAAVSALAAAAPVSAPA
jgi:putative tryptophan/tyrosine transport system substrate-binding protein